MSPTTASVIPMRRPIAASSDKSPGLRSHRPGTGEYVLRNAESAVDFVVGVVDVREFGVVIDVAYPHMSTLCVPVDALDEVAVAKIRVLLPHSVSPI